MRIEVDDFVEHKSNTLQGFFTVYFPDWGIAIGGFSLHEKKATGSRWVDLPAKPNKKGAFEKVVTAYDSRLAKKFREELLDLLDEHLRDRNAKVKKDSDTDLDFLN